MNLMAVRRVTGAFIVAMAAVIVHMVAFQVVYGDRGDLAIVGLLFSGVYTVAWISINHRQQRDIRLQEDGDHAAHEVDGFDTELEPAVVDA